MTDKIMDYEKAYKAAFCVAESRYKIEKEESVKICLELMFPELRESEDERIRKWIYNLVENLGYPADEAAEKELEEMQPLALAYLEKQKEQKELPLMDGNADLYFDEWNQQKQNPTKRQCFEEGIRYAQRLQKEQKPASTEDMPYITDEHFYEREPVDSFRYKLAEYMTQNCRKEESPDGYTYHISAETILEMAKEELLKRGVVQKPAEWSEEDEKMRCNILNALTPNLVYSCGKGTSTGTSMYKYDEEIRWLKSLHPQKTSQYRFKEHITLPNPPDKWETPLG